MCFDIWQNSLDEDNQRFVPDEVFETLETTQEVVEGIIESYKDKSGPYVYAIFLNKENINIGYVQFVQIQEGWEIGYHIAKKYTGHGYATMAVNLFLSYLKENTNLKEIYGVALADNLASRRVLEKSGFVLFFEGEDQYQGQLRNIIKTIKNIK